MNKLEDAIDMWLGFLFAGVLTVLGICVIVAISIATLKMLGVLG